MVVVVVVVEEEEAEKEVCCSGSCMRSCAMQARRKGEGNRHDIFAVLQERNKLGGEKVNKKSPQNANDGCKQRRNDGKVTGARGRASTPAAGTGATSGREPDPVA